jgi:hypothetical protein
MIPLRPVAARARRIADIVASVPDDTNRTRSHEGTRPMTRRASSFSSSVGAPKVTPFAAWSRIAATTRGCV